MKGRKEEEEKKEDNKVRVPRQQLLHQYKNSQVSNLSYFKTELNIYVTDLKQVNLNPSSINRESLIQHQFSL